MSRADRSSIARTATSRGVVGDHVRFLGSFFSRTPGPPPFSSMNSMPAACNAIRILFAVSLLPPRGPSVASNLLMVGMETWAATANSPCDQAKSARAALTCRIDTFSIDFFFIQIDTFGIERFARHPPIGERPMPQPSSTSIYNPGRRYFIGGSDARVIMGNDEAALHRLWLEKRGELEPEDLSGNLVVQLGVVTEHLNRQWYERNTGQAIRDVHRRMHHPVVKWMAATLDGVVEATGAVFEAKFMLPWSFSEEMAAEKYTPQVQHNMWVTNATTSVLSAGGGKWVEIAIAADSLYQHLLFTAEKTFWRCVESGDPPRLFGVEPPRPRIEAVRVVDMSASNSWAEFAGLFRQPRAAFLQHENARAELKALMPEDAKEAAGHGVRAKRSKSGAISFDLLEVEAEHAALQ
jgi:hypothetical protein